MGFLVSPHSFQMIVFEYDIGFVSLVYLMLSLGTHKLSNRENY